MVRDQLIAWIEEPVRSNETSFVSHRWDQDVHLKKSAINADDEQEGEKQDDGTSVGQPCV